MSLWFHLPPVPTWTPDYIIASLLYDIGLSPKG